jgi:hypothetical protein
MNSGYVSDRLTFINALHPSLKYPNKIQSFIIKDSNANYFVDDLFQMVLLNVLHSYGKTQVRILKENATTDEDFITKPYDNLYYSYHHKNFKRQRFLLSHLKNKNDGDIHFRNFYGARKKYNNLTEVLCK